MNNNITLISVDKLHPHPDNPRKNVGDISELTASIKKNGVYQNLTIVPTETTGNYTVVMGHRRLTAAKAAGLTEVPCVIASMTPQEQAAAMLAENMQRKDLTPVEEIQGIQMCIELGGTTDTVAEMTGLSKKSVKDKAKLIPIVESESLQKAYNDGKQITFADMERVLKIEDEKDRENAVGFIGTNAFDSQCNSILKKQRRLKRLEELCAALEKAGAVEITQNTSGFKYETWVDNMDRTNDRIDYFNSKGWEIYYSKSEYSDYISLYRKDSDITEENNTGNMSEVAAAAKEAERRKTERVQQLNDLAARCYKQRYNFIKSFSLDDIREKSTEILMFVAMIQTVFDGYGATQQELAQMLDVELPESSATYNFDVDYNKDFEPFAPGDENQNEWLIHLLLVTSYIETWDSSNAYYHDFSDGAYEENETLDFLYRELVKLGYEISDEETAYMNGTHELFAVESGA